MKIQDLLMEAPLPDDWDKSTFSKRIPFARQIRYAKEKAKSIGTGSSRVAFIVPYQGRNTVLKIAKNKKGIAQNIEEISLLNDWFLKGLNLTIPIIDSDESDEDHPTWIHTEYATKIKDSDFIKLTGLPLYRLMQYAEHMSGRKQYKYLEKDFEKIKECEFVDNLTDFAGNYTQVRMGDFGRLANWGLYDGRPVIIDLGLTDSTAPLYGL